MQIEANQGGMTPFICGQQPSCHNFIDTAQEVSNVTSINVNDLDLTDVTLDVILSHSLINEQLMALESA